MSCLRPRKHRKVFALFSGKETDNAAEITSCIRKKQNSIESRMRSGLPEYFQWLKNKKQKSKTAQVLETAIMESDPIETWETGHVEVTLYDPKMVQFADPLVTESWEIPKIRRQYKRRMFYSTRDIRAFRSQSRLRFGKNFGYDIIDCEEMLEDLDLIGALNSARGDLPGALKAFNHALRVRTQTKVDFDPIATSRNIQCIADIYTDQGNWTKALAAYRAALQALGDWKGREGEFQETVSCLNQRVEIIEENLSKQSMHPKPSNIT